MDVNEWGFFTLKEKVLKLGYDSSYDVNNDESEEDDECEWASDEDFVEVYFTNSNEALLDDMILNLRGM
nr:hypothetical protein Iba_chr02cCG10820 [Ipomoea batatas]